MNKNIEVIYIYDTLCGWCNIAKPEIIKLSERMDERIKFVFLHRKLFTKGNIPKISNTFLKNIYSAGNIKGSELIGQTFSDNYFKLIEKENFIHDSGLTARAAAASIIMLGEKKSHQFMHILQSLIFDKGFDPNSKEILIEATRICKIESSQFIKFAMNTITNELLEQNLKMAITIQASLKNNGFPGLFLKTSHKIISLNPFDSNKVLNEVIKYSK